LFTLNQIFGEQLKPYFFSKVGRVKLFLLLKKKIKVEKRNKKEKLSKSKILLNRQLTLSQNSK